jgi:hypothetical protein
MVRHEKKALQDKVRIVYYGLRRRQRLEAEQHSTSGMGLLCSRRRKLPSIGRGVSIEIVGCLDKVDVLKSTWYGFPKGDKDCLQEYEMMTILE